MDYYKITVKPKTDNIPPYFIGSMLRGSFGHALKQVICINPSYRCNGCFALEKCLYYDFYEKQNIQHKYRFDIKVNQKEFNFNLYLFAESCSNLSYVLSALEITLKENGLGKERIKFKNIQVYVNNISIYKRDFISCKRNIEPSVINNNTYFPNVKIKLLTPLRLKKGNKLKYTDITIEHILRSIYQRYKQIFENKNVYSLSYEPKYITSIKTLEYKPIYRKSDRQNKKIIMDGVLGEMAVIGLDEESYKLLKIGEIIGVGKQTVFGFGKIKLDEI